MLKVIGGAQEGEFKAVASGTLPNGKAVIVNSDGTVSIITGATGSTGTNTEIAGQAVYDSAAVYDTTNDKVVVMYRRDSGGVGYYKVGTVTGTTVTFGAEGTFNGGGTAEFISACYDSTNDRVVVVFEASGGVTSSRVGAVSGTTVTWGSAVTVAASAGSPSISYDEGQDAVVVAYQRDSDLYGMVVVGETITSGGGYINWGTPVVINSADTFSDKSNQTIVYDSNAQKTVVAYRDKGNSQLATARVCTVNGTSLTVSLGAEATATNGAKEVSLAFDSVNNKVVLTSIDNVTDLGYVAIGTVSGTSISFGTPVDYSGPSGSTGVSKPRICFDSNAGKILITYRQQSGAQSYFYRTGEVSGTSVTIDTAVEIDSGANSGTAFPVYDPDQNTILINFSNTAVSDEFYSLPLQLSFTNLTAENYIGMSSGPASPETLGSAVTFTTAVPQRLCGVYDTNTQKVVLAYNDNQNSNHGTAVVGTVVGTTISFGTPVVFEAAGTNEISMAYDSTNNKVVLSYEDEGNSYYGTSIVGTVSGTSISFGTPTVFQSTNIGPYTATVYDTNAQKVVVYYEASSTGKGIVGTVSGTSISFGTAVEFNSATTQYIAATYDSTSNKSIVVYRDVGNSSYGTARVGTVSGTSISFGSEAVFNAGNTEFPVINYDATSNKSVVFFKDAADSDKGKVIIGTVSGTSISFGSEVDVTTGAVFNPAVSSSPDSGKFILAYRDLSNSSYGMYRFGTISGTTPTLETAVVFNEANTQNISIVYDPNNTNLVLSYQDGGNSSAGTSKVLQEASSGSVADGDAATIDIIGAVSTNQGNLTAGEKYYVQNDGTLSTTAGDPSVLAGTAISATKLVVKT